VTDSFALIGSVIALFLGGIYLHERWNKKREMKAALKLIYSKEEIERVKQELERLDKFRTDKVNEAYDAKKAYDADYRNGDDGGEPRS
jgi:hypothetical protein